MTITQAEVKAHPLYNPVVDGTTDWEKIAKIYRLREQHLLAFMRKYIEDDDLVLEDMERELLVYDHVIGKKHQDLTADVKQKRTRRTKEQMAAARGE